jgi:hypothetical protein
MTDSAPTLVNKPVAVVEAIIHALIAGVGKTGIIALGISLQPWLAYPGIKQLFSWLVGYLTENISKALQETAADAIIDAQAQAQKKACNEAFDALKQAEEQGDDNALTLATNQVKEALGRLIHYGGS